MRIAVGFVLPFALFSAGCALANLLDTGTSSSTSTTTAATTTPADGGIVDTTSVTGATCGIDTQSGETLCRAVSTCPTVVVNSDTFPHCGFRIRGGAVDLVCGCAESICSMGAYSTCAQAASFLATQTEQQVCVQVSEDRCSITRRSSTPSTSSSGGNPACDHQCLSECGGGAACASVCGC